MERTDFKSARRIIVKVGSSTITRPETGAADLIKIEKLVRELCAIKNMGKDVILVSSGAIAIGRNVLNMENAPKNMATKQACASVGQGSLMMIYNKIFNEYGIVSSQVLINHSDIESVETKANTVNTLERLLELNVIPIINENDTVSTYEILYGDNDNLSAIVAEIVHADLLIILSDIDGLYTDDPNKNPEAKLIHTVETLNDKILAMGGDSSSGIGTGGMATKLSAAKIACNSGVGMVIASGEDVSLIHEIIDGNDIGTFFVPDKSKSLKRL